MIAASAPHRTFIHEGSMPNNQWRSDTQFVDFLKRMDYLDHVSDGVTLYMYEAWRASRTPSSDVNTAAVRAASALCTFTEAAGGVIARVPQDVLQQTIAAVEDYAVAFAGRG